jgi:DNA repair protein RadC
MSKNIKDMPEYERPREKLQMKGAEALSDVELMAILLGSGTKGHDVMKVAGRILKVLDGNPKQISIEELQKIEGVGLAKATLIAAALEFARRRIRPEGLKISTPADVLPLIQHYADRKQKAESGTVLINRN